MKAPMRNLSRDDGFTIIEMLISTTVAEFRPVVSTPPTVAGVPPPTEGTLSADGKNVPLSVDSLWLLGDAVGDTPKMKVGDLVLYVSTTGNAIQTVTSVDATHIYF